MKMLVLATVCVLLISSTGWGQSLVDVYKSGKVSMTPDPTFKPEGNLFSLFNQSPMYFENVISNFGKMAISHQGEIFVLNRGNYSIFKFGNDGSFIKRFGTQGYGVGEFRYRPGALDILDNRYIITGEYSSGRINVFDLNGNFVKAIQLDYPLFDCVALKNNLVAVHGLILYKSGKTKYYVATVNIDTEDENPITYFMEERKNKGWFTIRNLRDEERKKATQEIMTMRQDMIAISSPAQSYRVCINKTVGGDLIVGYSKYPEIVIYSATGEAKAKITLNYSPEIITQEEKDEYIRSMEKVIKAYAVLPDSTIEVIKSPDYFQAYLPYYYTIMTDSENNILVFKFVKDKDHVFQVYQVFSERGNFICETTLDPGDYQSPKLKLLAFHNGALMCLLQEKDESDSNKIDLVKVQLKK